MAFLRKAAGATLIAIGLFALLTPLTPGSWLIFVGAELLGLELVLARKVATHMRNYTYTVPILCFTAPVVAALIGGLVTWPAVRTWYPSLVQPWWTPPAYMFGPVWSVLYLLMGLSAFLVWRARRPERGFALTLFFVHLSVNVAWSVVFFGLHAVRMALAVIVVLWLMIAWLIVLFARQSNTAAWLMAPYLVWVTYAASLNLGIFFLN